MNRKLVYYPEPILRQKAHPVRDFTDDLPVLAQEMRRIMKENAGMGLAAPQIGDSRRIIVVEYVPHDPKETAIPFTVLINPEITPTTKKTDVMQEGCLSIPYVEVEIERPTEVLLTAQDLQGNPIQMKAKGLFARILQHEVDHLNGTLILDYETEAHPADKPKTIVWGSTEFTTAIMNTIRHDVNITHILTEPAKPKGRNQVLTPTVAKQYADTLGIPTIEPDDLTDPRLYTYLLSLKPDLMIVAAYGRLIPEKLFTLPQFGTLNVHPSLLPKYRGATPIQAAILNGDSETGVTIMQLAAKFDTGDIVAKVPYKLDGTETYKDLEFELATLGAEMLAAILPKYLRNEIMSMEQDDEEATGTKKITREACWLNLEEPAKINERKVRAYSPDPGAFVILDGEPLKVLQAHIEQGQLVFDQVQKAGKKPMSWKEFLNGYRKPLHFEPYEGILSR